MRRFGMLQAALGSFYSKSLYQHVGSKGRGAGLIYLLLIVVVCWIPRAVRVQLEISSFIDHEAADIVAQMPRITIDHGEMSTEEPRPYRIRDSKTGKLLVIIDCTEQDSTLENRQPPLVLTRRQLLYRKSERETRTYALSGIQHLTLDQSGVRIWLQLARIWLAVLLSPFAIAFFFALRCIEVLVCAAIGLSFGRRGPRLAYPVLMRLAGVGITPFLFLDTIRSMVNWSVPHSGWIGFLSALAYLFLAVRWNAEPVEQSSPGMAAMR